MKLARTREQSLLQTMLGLIQELVILSLLGSIITLVPAWHWILEINLNFSVYYLLLHLISIVFLLVYPGQLTRYKWISTLIGLCIMCWMHMHPMLPFFRSPPPAPSGGQSIKFLYANVETESRNYPAFRAILDQAQPDVIVLVETDAAWIQALSLAQTFPHCEFAPRSDNFGLSVCSKFPFKGEIIKDVGEELPPIRALSIEPVSGLTIDIVALHLLPPVAQEALRVNRLMLRRIAGVFRSRKETTMVVLGDFNATPHSSLYMNFRDWLDLTDAYSGFGYLRTWNAKVSYFRLFIDHILYRGALTPISVQRLSSFGSDHYPFLVEFALKDEKVSQE